MLNFKKLDRSNKAHKRLSDKHNDLANKYSDSSSKKFWHLVKRDYHDEVLRFQSKHKKMMSKRIRFDIYKESAESLADYRKGINKSYGFNRYIPKKYR